MEKAIINYDLRMEEFLRFAQNVDTNSGNHIGLPLRRNDGFFCQRFFVTSELAAYR